MENEFVTYKQAVRLEKLGFKKPCFSYYDTALQFKTFIGITSEILKYDGVIAPLKQQVFRWFREEHNLDYNIINWHNCLENWCFRIMNLVMDESNNLDFDSYIIEENNDSYEDAELACIDKLISLIEAKN